MCKFIASIFWIFAMINVVIANFFDADLVNKELKYLMKKLYK